MRDIKFRIWDKEKKEWLGKSDKDSLVWYGFHLVGECMTVQAPPVWALDNGIVEEYTNCKDKNGQEIYEGDIVKSTNKGELAVIVRLPTGEFATHLIERDEEYTLYYRSRLCEVIGNIHENPELLDKEQDGS